ncbi:hypothetical protein B0T14DRAFT_140938 [Immersiella caudata]|uniref:Uncharacterized protein n=1 Tax=Immersiella caudata TaxID=314043 RepID=A0AA39X6E2_9PEZI|nr:hypothetical protein B0T14DRAFT_140938 [Immersiella caudata]
MFHSDRRVVLDISTQGETRYSGTALQPSLERDGSGLGRIQELGFASTQRAGRNILACRLVSAQPSGSLLWRSFLPLGCRMGGHLTRQDESEVSTPEVVVSAATDAKSPSYSTTRRLPWRYNCKQESTTAWRLTDMPTMSATWAQFGSLDYLPPPFLLSGEMGGRLLLAGRSTCLSVPVQSIWPLTHPAGVRGKGTAFPLWKVSDART